MKSPKTTRQHARPVAGQEQEYPLFGASIWTDWAKANSTQQAQARAIDKSAAVPGSLLLIAKANGRTCRVIPPAQQAANAA